jgi:Uma2 family endonuclease
MPPEITPEEENSMTPQTAAYQELIEHLTPDATLTLHGMNWQTYEDILEMVGEAPPLRISYNEGVIQIMSISFEHEFISQCLSDLLTLLKVVSHIKMVAFGRATLKSQAKLKGAEPDACYYVQSAVALGNRFRLSLETDPPPDIVVEVDIKHESKAKFPIYAALGVSELWRYDGTALTIYQLQKEQYVETPASPALPLLNGSLLTGFLQRCQSEGQYEALLGFEEWLRAQAGTQAEASKDFPGQLE